MQAAILDVISIWPLAALPIAVVVLRNRLANKRSPTRRKGPTFHIPLLLLIWMVVGVALHLVGWGRLPSSSAILNGPEAPDRLVSATLDIRTSGEVRLEGGGILLYEVTPLRSGGSAGPAQATESMDNGKATISLEESADAGWFGSHGWIVSVSESPQWDLTVRAPGLEADLTTTQLQSLSVHADGRVRLGPPSNDVSVYLDGAVTLEVAVGVPIEVEGSAEVGPEWEVTASGARYAGTGEFKYVVLVEPDSQIVVEQE